MELALIVKLRLSIILIRHKSDIICVKKLYLLRSACGVVTEHGPHGVPLGVLGVGVLCSSVNSQILWRSRTTPLTMPPAGPCQRRATRCRVDASPRTPGSGLAFGVMCAIVWVPRAGGLGPACAASADCARVSAGCPSLHGSKYARLAIYARSSLPIDASLPLRIASESAAPARSRSSLRARAPPCRPP